MTFWDDGLPSTAPYVATCRERVKHPELCFMWQDTVEFRAKEGENGAKITLTRHGRCAGPVHVRVRTRDGRKAEVG